MTQQKAKGTADDVENTQADLAQQDGGSALADTQTAANWRHLNTMEWAAAGSVWGWSPKEVAELIRPDDWSETEDGEAVRDALRNM